MHRLCVSRISRLAIGMVLIALGVTQPSWVEVHAAGEGWYSSWQLRKAITIDATKVSSGPHTNFPVLINLTSDVSLAARAQADGDDILFTSSNGATKLSHEIEKYTSSTGALVAWVKVPSLSSASNTVLYMYYDNAAAASQQDATNVWDANYQAVWHMKEDPSGAAPQIKDSTSNARHGTSRGSMTSTDVVAGQIGNSLDFDAVNDAIDTSNFMSSGITQLSAEAWVFKDTTKDARIVYKNTPANTGNPNFGLASGGITDPVRGRLTTTAGSADVSGTTAITLSTWTLAAFTYDGSNVRIYKNGALETTFALTGTLSANSNTVVIATNDTGATDRFWPGRLDEVRLSNVARSTGWLLTEFNNQGTPTTFYAVGSATSSPANFFQLFE